MLFNNKHHHHHHHPNMITITTTITFVIGQSVHNQYCYRNHNYANNCYNIHIIIKCKTSHSFIHSDHFYSAPSSPLPLRGAPDYSTDTVSEFHAEAHRQLQVKDLPKVPT